MNQTDKNIAMAKECGATVNGYGTGYGTVIMFLHEIDEYTSRVCAEKDARIAELERELSDYSLCNNWQAQSIGELSREIEEAERKLAEQQARCGTAVAVLRDIPAGRENDIGLLSAASKLASRTLQINCEDGSELSNLLAKAKEEGRKEAVPEGWQVVHSPPQFSPKPQGETK